MRNLSRHQAITIGISVLALIISLVFGFITIYFNYYRVVHGFSGNVNSVNFADGHIYISITLGNPGNQSLAIADTGLIAWSSNQASKDEFDYYVIKYGEFSPALPEVLKPGDIRVFAIAGAFDPAALSPDRASISTDYVHRIEFEPTPNPDVFGPLSDGHINPNSCLITLYVALDLQSNDPSSRSTGSRLPVSWMCMNPDGLKNSARSTHPFDLLSDQ